MDGVGSSCKEVAAGRSEHTQNLWGLEKGPALLSWGSTETTSFKPVDEGTSKTKRLLSCADGRMR